MGDRCETCGEDYTCRRCKCMRTDVTPPDDAPQAGQREVIAQHLAKRFGRIRWAEQPLRAPVDWYVEADAILSALNLTPPEPKEGGHV